MGQVANKWFGILESATTTIYYRYKLSPDGAVNITTTTINLYDVAGVDTSDVSNVNLYIDNNSDGASTSEMLVASGNFNLSGGGLGTKGVGSRFSACLHSREVLTAYGNPSSAAFPFKKTTPDPFRPLPTPFDPAISNKKLTQLQAVSSASVHL